LAPDRHRIPAFDSAHVGRATSPPIPRGRVWTAIGDRIVGAARAAYRNRVVERRPAPSRRALSGFVLGVAFVGYETPRVRPQRGSMPGRSDDATARGHRSLSH